MEDRYQELKTAEKGAIVSIFAYILVTIFKLVVGIWGNSEALKADGLNNFTDIISSIAILIGLHLARRPADDDHRYGHWKVEMVASMLASFIMLAVGLQVLVSAITKMTSGITESPDPLSAVVGILSAIIMYGVYLYNKKLSKKVRSQALMAAAKDNLSDAWTSIGTAVAVFASTFNMHWLDGFAAIVVGLLIIKTAIEIFHESAFSLSDGFDEESLLLYKQAILKIDGVEAIRSIRGRSYGANIFLDVVVLMNPKMTVQKSHDITEAIEEMLKLDFQVFDTDVHVEPCNP